MSERPFPYRNRLRRIVAWVLFAWLFSLGVGMAHACGLTPGDLGFGIDGDDHAAVVSAPSPAPSATDPPADDLEAVSCVKHCSEVKAVNSATESDGELPAPALPPHELTLHARDPDASGTPPRAYARGSGAPRPAPIVIEFLRLAL